MFISYRNQFINEKHILNETKGQELLWTFPNSVFFATTVITTIGTFKPSLINLIAVLSYGLQGMETSCQRQPPGGLPVSSLPYLAFRFCSWRLRTLANFSPSFWAFCIAPIAHLRERFVDALSFKAWIHLPCRLPAPFQIRRQSRRISHHYRSTSQSQISDQASKAGSINLGDFDSGSGELS